MFSNSSVWVSQFTAIQSNGSEVFGGYSFDYNPRTHYFKVQKSPNQIVDFNFFVFSLSSLSFHNYESFFRMAPPRNQNRAPLPSSPSNVSNHFLCMWSFVFVWFIYGRLKNPMFWIWVLFCGCFWIFVFSGFFIDWRTPCFVLGV